MNRKRNSPKRRAEFSHTKSAMPETKTNNGEKPKRKPIPRATVQRVARSFKPYQGQLVAIAVLVLASAALGILSPFYLRVIINDGLLQAQFRYRHPLLRC